MRMIKNTIALIFLAGMLAACSATSKRPCVITKDNMSTTGCRTDENMIVSSEVQALIAD